MRTLFAAIYQVATLLHKSCASAQARSALHASLACLHKSMLVRYACMHQLCTTHFISKRLRLLVCTHTSTLWGCKRAESTDFRRSPKIPKSPTLLFLYVTHDPLETQCQQIYHEFTYIHVLHVHVCRVCWFSVIWKISNSARFNQCNFKVACRVAGFSFSFLLFNKSTTLLL